MTVAGVIVLLVNDHLLKQAWPGFVTGKLSDAAGLVVAPALLALLCPRRADLAATVLTGALFALVKTTETGAEVASHVWTLVAGPSRVLADPTDLLALPALALAWWVRNRSLESRRATARPAFATAGGRTGSRSRWASSGSRRRIILTVPLAVLAVTATAAAEPPVAHSVEADAKRIIVHVRYGPSWISTDGGAGWSEAAATGQTTPGQHARCVAGQATRCYRVVADRMAVEQSDDGGATWGPSWALSQNDTERLNRAYSSLDGRYSMALATQSRAGGHVVVVANGLDGILVRDVSGTWRRVGWPGADPSETLTVDLATERNLALLLAACLLFGGIGAGLRQFQRLYTGFAATACLGFFAATGDAEWVFLDIDVTLGVRVLGVLATVAGTVVCLALAFAGRARPAPVAVSAGAAPLVYASVYLPFHAWAAGVSVSYEAAVAFAVVLTALVLLGAVTLIKVTLPQAEPDDATP